MPKIIFLILLYLLSAPSITSAFETQANYAVLVDHATGKVLFDKNANEQMVPSSMTKLMTAYIIMQHLQKDVLKLEDKFTVSEKAWRKGGSKTFLRHTDRVTIDTLLNGIIVQSGNDACITAAEGISENEEAFATLMNNTAQEIGLNNSHFKNSTGWPDAGHYMSAYDIATLGRAIITEFPEYYHYFSKPDYTYSDIKQQNRNTLLFRNIGVDGLKTGHTEDGGYGMIASAEKEGRRLVAVVNGLANETERADAAEKLLNYGMRYFATKTLFTKGQKISEAKVYQGTAQTVPLVTSSNINLLIPKLRMHEIQVSIKYQSPITAPIKQDQHLAQMTITIPDLGEQTYPLIASEPIKRTNWAQRLVSKIVK